MLDSNSVSRLLSVIHPRAPSGLQLKTIAADFSVNLLFIFLRRDRKVNPVMEYLAPEHQDIAIQGLDKLRAKLPSVQEDIFERLKAEEWSFPRSFKLAQENMKRNLPTASVLWEYMLDKAENKQQKFAILNKLFQVQIATGPWKAALETAQKLFDETSAQNSSENANRQTANDRGLGTLNLFFVYLLSLFQGQN